MKAAVLEALNQPIVVREIEEPEPGDGEIVIRQTMTGICYRDILTQEGFLPRARVPNIPGHEISGVIAKVGPNVENFHVGDRVATLIYIPCGECIYCRSGRENLCPKKVTIGETVPGSYTSQVKVPSKIAIKIPESIPEALASLTACVTGMVYHAIAVTGAAREGERILITGAGGGVGSHAIQVAKALCLEVFASTSSPGKKDALEKLGADHVIDEPDFDSIVKKVTDSGVDLVLECVGLPTFAKSLRSLNYGGRMIVIGNLIPKSVELPLGLIILKGNRIEGSISSTLQDMKKVTEMAMDGKLRAVVSEEIPLEKVNEAYSNILKKGNTGRVMIRL